MSLMSLSTPGKDSFVKKGRIPNIGQQHSLDSAGHDRDQRKPDGLSQLSTTSDGGLTRRKALVPLNSTENFTVPTRDPFNSTGKIPGISGSNLSKTKRHDHGLPNSALDIQLPTKDHFTKAGKIPGISGSAHGKTKRHDHDEPTSVLDTGLPTKDPFTKAGKISGISGSAHGKTKRHDHDEPTSVLDTGLPTKDPFTKAAKIPGILGGDFGRTKRHDHDEPKTVLSTGLPTKDPFTKVAKIPGILGSELRKTKRHDHDEPKTVLDTGLPTKDPFTKAAKIPGILGGELGKTKRHDHDGPSLGFDQGQQYLSNTVQTPLQSAGNLGKLSTGSDGTLSRRKSLAPIGNGIEADVLSGKSFTKAAKYQGTLGGAAGHQKHKSQEMDIHKELNTRISGNSARVMGEDSEAYSNQSTDEEEFYRQHILAQEQLRGQGHPLHDVMELQQGNDVDMGVYNGIVEQTSKKEKKKGKKRDKKDKGKKKVTSAAWPNVSRGHKFEDMPYFRQIRMRYPNDPYHGLPLWAKFYPTPPGHEKMPIPEMYQGGATPYDMAADYEGMYGAGRSPHGGFDGMHGAGGPPHGGFEGMQHGQDVRDMYQGMYGGL